MQKRNTVVLSLTWFVSLLVFPLPLVLVLNSAIGDFSSQTLLIDCGAIAYAWWLLEVFLATRPKWLDRLIGLPAMYLIHGLLGVGALIAAFFHRHFLFSMGRWITLTGDWAWYLILFGVIFAAVFMSGWLVDRLPLAAKVKQRVQPLIKHQVSVWLHRLNLVAILLIWLHVHLIGRLNSHLGFMLLFDLYTVAIFGCYVWTKFGQSDQRLVGTIISANQLNALTTQFVVQFDKSKLAFNAGDFFFFTFPDISNEAHPFSVSNTPIVSAGQLVIMVKQVGDETQKLSTLPANSRVLIEGPYGHFNSVINGDNRPLVLIGLGAGVAPLIGIATTYQDYRQIHLIETVRTNQDDYWSVAAQTQLDASVKRHRKVGRLTVSNLDTLLSAEEKRFARYIIVGPAPAVLSVRKMLRQVGVSRQQLTDERLTM